MGHSIPFRRPSSGFTLGELLVAIAVLTLVIVFISQLMNGATRITTAGHKRMDSESQAQQIFDRIAADFNGMIKRTDVSYYFKGGGPPAMPGNDQIAFFSSVAGHYPQSNYISNASLVAYRINANSSTAGSYNRLERMGKGLAWNGASTTYTPIVFLPLAISGTWSTATDNTSVDPDYGLAGSQVFRFEYYYVMNPNGPSGSLHKLSDGVSTWGNSYSQFQIKDIAAIVVAIAVIDAKSRRLLSTSQMELLAGTHGQTSPFVDFTGDHDSAPDPNALLATWQTTLTTDSRITAMPRQATQNVRFYERYFALTQ